MATDVPSITGDAAGHQPFCAASARPFILISAILASAMGFIDGSVLAIALPALRADLGIGLGAAQWVSNGYAVILSSLILVGGIAGDRFGTKRVFGLGVFGFAFASLLCALAPNGATLIAARLLQGFAAAFMVPGSLSIISQAYPADERGKAIGTWAAVSALTTAIGPIAGGFLLSVAPDSAWRWIFAINLPIAALVLYFLFVRVKGDTQTEQKPLDWLGGLLATAGLGLIALGLTAPETAHGPVALSVRDVGLTLGGFVLLGLFVFHEARTPHPLMPLQVFRHLPFSVGNIITFFIYFSLSAILFYLPMTLIGGWGYDEGVIGLLFGPFALAIGLLSRISGGMADRFGAPKVVAAGAFVVTIAYVGIVLGAPTGEVFTVMMPLILLLGLGMGLLIAPLSAVVMASVRDGESGIASGVNNAVSRVGGVIAVAACGRLAAAIYASGLPEEPVAGFAYGARFEGAAELASIHAAASSSALVGVATLCAVFCAIGAVLSLTALKPAPKAA